jgi:exopolysaccharide production protein ExoY
MHLWERDHMIAGCVFVSVRILPWALPGSLARVRDADSCSWQSVGGVTKRLLDLAGASLALVLLAPIMLVIAGLVRAFIGPAVFAQKRIGFGGKPFVCYKFRTMVIDGEEVLRRHLAADPQAAEEWRKRRKLRDDPRVRGCLGNVLRKSSLDELPQLINVLRGEMSLVGPRPVVPEEIERYGRHARACFQARPGLTGMWQVGGRNGASYTARIARDLYYARNWSLWLDLAVLIRTIPAIVNFDQSS